MIGGEPTRIVTTFESPPAPDTCTSSSEGANKSQSGTTAVIVVGDTTIAGVGIPAISTVSPATKPEPVMVIGVSPDPARIVLGVTDVITGGIVVTFTLTSTKAMSVPKFTPICVLPVEMPVTTP